MAIILSLPLPSWFYLLPSGAPIIPASRCHPSWRSFFPWGRDGQRYQSYELRLSLQVSRYGCHRNETYRVLSEKEGEEEVQLWHQRFLSLTRG